MSSNTYAAPLALEISPSVPFALVLACAHGGAVVVLALLPLPYWLIAVLTVVVLAHAVHAIRRHALLRDAKSVVRVLWDAQDEWRLTRRDGTTFYARLLPGSYRHPLLTVLNFKVSTWRRTSVVILPKRVDAEAFRQLRVRMLLVSSSPE
jgi:hypothetical protein